MDDIIKKYYRRSLIIISAIVITIIAFYMITGKDIIQSKVDKTSEVALLQDRLVELSELAILKYEYHNVIVSRVEQSLTLPMIPDIKYAETIKLIEYSGYLKAGTDLSKAQIAYDPSTKKVSVKIPKSQILDNVVETESTKVEDIKGNLLSDYPTQTVFDEINAHKKQLEEEKIAQGFLSEADERIRQVMTSFFKANGYEDVLIELY